MKDYIGDGVYISDEVNAGHITLTTGSHLTEDADNIIHLEPEVLGAMQRWLGRRDTAFINESRDKIKAKIPEPLQAQVHYMNNDQIDIDNLSRSEVVEVMHALAAGRWERAEGAVEGTLDYKTKIAGFTVRLWAAAPPDSCRVVEEEYEIPASKGIRKRVICGHKEGDPVVAAAPEIPVE